MSAIEPPVEDAVAEDEATPLAEEEQIEISQLQSEPINEVIPELESMPEEVPTVPEAQPTLEPEQKPKPVSAPEPSLVPAPSETVTDPQPGDMVYVPGFGWQESQGPGEAIHDESIYENGNKIGVMG